MKHSQFFLITGSGSKIGKTFLAVEVIRHFTLLSGIIGLKISPHVHDNLGNVERIAMKERYRIFREMEVHEKNSGRYLEAGAAESYFIETADEVLPDAIREFLEKCNPRNLPVVCESGALGTVMDPGVMIFIEDQLHPPDQVKLFQKQKADLVLPARSFNPLSVIEKIHLDNGNWRI